MDAGATGHDKGEKSKRGKQDKGVNKADKFDKTKGGKAAPKVQRRVLLLLQVGTQQGRLQAAEKMVVEKAKDLARMLCGWMIPGHVFLWADASEETFDIEDDCDDARWVMMIQRELGEWQGHVRLAFVGAQLAYWWRQVHHEE